mmetsp:Transcript_8098/g.50090  ORF Transcript_8098/g.50090 Transcript_8098/m.50090 type:complete len:455 (-) Transcript_8098:494-1858(-)
MRAMRAMLLVRRSLSNDAFPPHVKLDMPALSPTMASGRIASWLKREGDVVQAGDAMAEIETDKATMPWDAQDDGVLAKILVDEDVKDVPVGTTVAVMVEDVEHVAAFANYGASDGAGSPRKQLDATKDEHLPNEPTKETNMRVWPSVRKLLAEHGLDLTQVRGTGRKGTVTKEDAIRAIEEGVSSDTTKEHVVVESKPTEPSTPEEKPTPATEEPKVEGEERIPHTNVRRVIAKRLLESKVDIPHLYVNGEAILDPILALRKELKAAGTPLSVNDFVLRACALALRQVPGANASWDADAREARFNKQVDISVAVATDGGLITPIVKRADEKTVDEISREVKDLASRARAGKLRPEEFQGGTFSISNLGMFGIGQFNAIINPPQACIMAVGAGLPQVVLRDGRPTTVTRMTVTLSADHRVYDGQVTSEFLNSFVSLLEHPVRLLGHAKEAQAEAA